MKLFRKSFFFIPPPVRFLPNNKKNKYNPARISSIKKSLQAVGYYPLSSYVLYNMSDKGNYAAY